MALPSQSNLNQCHLDENDFKTLSLCLNDTTNKKLPKLKFLVLFFGEVLDDRFASIFDFHRHDATGIKFERGIDLAMLSIFHGPWSSISTLSLHSVNKEEYKDIVVNLNNGSMPNLKNLFISMWQHMDIKVQYPIQRYDADGIGTVDFHKTDRFKWLYSVLSPELDPQTMHFVFGTLQHQFLAARGKQLTKAAGLVRYLEINQIDWLYPINLPTITHLTLQRFICSVHHLYMMTKSKNSDSTKEA